jgi:hypothetical protein
MTSSLGAFSTANQWSVENIAGPETKKSVGREVERLDNDYGT